MCCNGKLCGEYAQSLGFPEEKITYGHMVADSTSLQNSSAKVTDKQVSDLRTKYDLKGTILLYVGRLIPRKGLIKLLNAWKRFISGISADKATLLLVGDGPQRGELEQYIKENNLNNVRFTGSVDYDSLAPYYKAAYAFIIPTLEDNWSLVVPEAMACGLPILCSKYNGCWPELVHPGENGWVFDPLDHKDVLQCLKKCIELKSRLPQMGEKSKVIVSDHTPVKAAESILRACKIAMVRH
jgi:glycosyltransferase involved in cell wall biosynthesis